MATIKSLNVSVKFSVGYGNVKVPQKVLKQLQEIEENGGEISVEDDHTLKFSDAIEWLSDNIKERDSLGHSWEIEMEE